MDTSEKKVLLVIAGILIVAGIFTWYRTSVQQAGNDTNPSANNQNLATAYRDLNGRAVNLATYENQVRVINSWASWCPFCVTELPDFVTLADEYADREVAVILINRKEPLSTIQSYLGSIELETNTNALFLQDERDTFYKSIGGITMPETVFYDAAGRVVMHKRGFMTLEEMRQHVETALEE